MKRFVVPSALLAALLTFALPAQAQNGSLTRSFVSSSGVDTNPCTITQPCGTFAQAYTKISANGIIAALDPGKYGPITIVGPVTINGNGWAAITGPAGGTAIAINAGTNDAVKLSGLELDGANVSGHGISFGGGASLTIENCVIRQFHFGIVTNAAPSQIVLTNSTIENNSSYGVLHAPVNLNGTLNFDHVQFLNNAIGMSVQDGNLPPGNVGILATGTNSSALSNGIGFEATATNLRTTLIFDNVVVEGNTTEGLHVKGGNILLSRSIVAGNALVNASTNAGSSAEDVGWVIENGGQLISVGNNMIWDSGFNTGSLFTNSSIVQ